MLILKMMYLFLMAVLDLLIDIRFGRLMHEQISLSILFGIDIMTAGMLPR